MENAPDYEAVPLKAYVDTRFLEMNRAVEAALAALPSGAVPLREYVETIFEEQRRGTLLAETEREKAAQALSEEREKAAQVLAINLRERIDESFRNLDSHIDAQVDQLKQLVESVQREQAIRHNSSQEAIAKAEVSVDKRLQALNGLQAVIAENNARLMPRELAESQYTELRRSIAELTEKVNKVV